MLLVPFLVSLLALGIFIALEFRRCSKAVYERLPFNSRATAVMLAFSPPAAIRAYDQFMKYALSELHPLALSYVLCSQEGFLSEASQ
jgi:hypothetical protein